MQPEKKTKDPFNIKLLDVSSDKFKMLPVVTNLDIMDGASKNFAPDGLYSIEIFGRVGDPERDRRFAQIHLRTKIMHHIIYKALTRTKGLYADIIAGKQYAKWNAKEKDFEPCDMTEGETGYGFFVKHLDSIEIKENNSPIRSMRAALLKKYKNVLTLDRVVVLPAGLRDAEITADGGVIQSDINQLYRRLISISNNIINATDPDSPLLDNIRRNLQTKFNELGESILDMLSGKTGFISRKFASRRVQNSTRNVITAIVPDRSRLDSERLLDMDQHSIGLFNHLKGIGGVGVHLMRTGIISKIFNGMTSQATLVNRKTLQPTVVDLTPDVVSEWTSIEGIEKLINLFGVRELRFNPVEVAGHYLALIYQDDKAFKVFQNIKDLPAHLDKANVRPINLFELIYLSVHKDINRSPATITRYPIAGLGSFYVSKTYVRTTSRALELFEMDDEWQYTENSPKVLEFPLKGGGLYDSLSPNPSRLEGLGGDFDGDQCNSIPLYTEEAIDEAERLSGNRETYVDTSGRLRTSLNIHPVSLLFNVMTGNRRKI